LRRALGAATTPAEAQTAGRAFVESLRVRGINGYDFVPPERCGPPPRQPEASTPPPPPPRQENFHQQAAAGPPPPPKGKNWVRGFVQLIVTVMIINAVKMCHQGFVPGPPAQGSSAQTHTPEQTRLLSDPTPSPTPETPEQREVSDRAIAQLFASPTPSPMPQTMFEIGDHVGVQLTMNDDGEPLLPWIFEAPLKTIPHCLGGTGAQPNPITRRY
jgi:hypothetical protein